MWKRVDFLLMWHAAYDEKMWWLASCVSGSTGFRVTLESSIY